jgi:murein tripeptide amidase MpaA
MTLGITSAFDGGNIEVLKLGASSAELAIRKDNGSDFYQWFYFRLSGARGREVELKLVNCGTSAYPDGWPGYEACVSEDRVRWRRAATSYEGGVLTIRYTPASDSAWFAYFAPYSMERHADLVARVGQAPGVTTRVIGQSLDGQDVDLVELGEGERHVWLYARQHPGETMAEWWMEGLLGRLIDVDDPVARRLRSLARFHVIPNMNPDGSKRGHLRTNAIGTNLNREWNGPSLKKSPEVYHALAAMDATGVDFAMDVHGDESIPHVFIAGFHGIPSITAKQVELYDRYRASLARISPDFQTAVGYPVARPGKANMSMSTNAVAERFGCVAFTLEMPFKDALEQPDPVSGWSPGRSAALGRDCLSALLDVVGDLR